MIRPNSLACARTRSFHRRRMAARSYAVLARQEGKAPTAASAQRRASTGPASKTSPTCWPVAGLITEKWLIASPIPFCLLTHELPETFHVRPFRRYGPNRNAHHPAAIKDCGSQVGVTGAIDTIHPIQCVFVESLTLQCGRLVADTDSLQRNRRKNAPVLRRPHLTREPLRVQEVTPQAFLQRCYTLL